MKKIILSLLLLCSIATYADTYYTTLTGTWNPTISNWDFFNFRKIRIDLTDHMLTIHDTYLMQFNFNFTEKIPVKTYSEGQYIDLIAYDKKYAYNIRFTFPYEGGMSIEIFQRNTEMGLIYIIDNE